MKTRKIDHKCTYNGSIFDCPVCIDQALEAEHTPTPWKAWSETTGGYGMYIRSANGDIVARGLIREDAAFIVRAVNSHEELKQKLYEAYHTFLNREKSEQWWFKEVEALLAKAEGKGE